MTEIYVASFSNIYAYPKVTLPSLEGVTPSCDCYTLETNPDGEYDQFTGQNSEDLTSKVETLIGSGAQIGASSVGETSFTNWCSAPSEIEVPTSAGYETEYQFGVVKIDSPNLSSSIDSDSVASLADRNLIRKAIRNADKVLNLTSTTSFADHLITDDATLTADVADMQQWIIDSCGGFVHPARVIDSSGLDYDDVQSPSGGYMTISEYNRQETGGSISDFEYFSRNVASLVTGTLYGFRFSNSLGVDQKPLVEAPNSDRVTTDGDYVTYAVFEDLAKCIDVLIGGYYSVQWVSNNEYNDSMGSSDEFDSWDDAVYDAESNIDYASGNTSPQQSSFGSYDATTSGSTSTSSSSDADSSSDYESESSSLPESSSDFA